MNANEWIEEQVIELPTWREQEVKIEPRMGFHIREGQFDKVYEKLLYVYRRYTLIAEDEMRAYAEAEFGETPDLDHGPAVEIDLRRLVRNCKPFAFTVEIENGVVNRIFDHEALMETRRNMPYDGRMVAIIDGKELLRAAVREGGLPEWMMLKRGAVCIIHNFHLGASSTPIATVTDIPVQTGTLWDDRAMNRGVSATNGKGFTLEAARKGRLEPYLQCN